MDVSLKGTSVEPDVDDMEAAYGEGTAPADVLQVGFTEQTVGVYRRSRLCTCQIYHGVTCSAR